MGTVLSLSFVNRKFSERRCKVTSLLTVKKQTPRDCTRIPRKRFLFGFFARLKNYSLFGDCKLGSFVLPAMKQWYSFWNIPCIQPTLPTEKQAWNFNLHNQFFAQESCLCFGRGVSFTSSERNAFKVTCSHRNMNIWAHEPFGLSQVSTGSEDRQLNTRRCKLGFWRKLFLIFVVDFKESFFLQIPQPDFRLFGAWLIWRTLVMSTLLVSFVLPLVFVALSWRRSANLQGSFPFKILLSPSTYSAHSLNFMQKGKDIGSVCLGHSFWKVNPNLSFLHSLTFPAWIAWWFTLGRQSEWEISIRWPERVSNLLVSKRLTQH